MKKIILTLSVLGQINLYSMRPLIRGEDEELKKIIKIADKETLVDFSSEINFSDLIVILGEKKGITIIPPKGFTYFDHQIKFVGPKMNIDQAWDKLIEYMNSRDFELDIVESKNMKIGVLTWNKKTK